MAAVAAHDDEDDAIYCGLAMAEIVGVQHYRGTIHPGETGTVRRQPSNPYDRNAIAVYSPHGGIQVGHIKREVAAVLAPLMDSRGLRLEPRVTSLGAYALQCDLDFFAPAGAVGAVHNSIRALSAFLRWPWLNFDPGAGPQAAPSQSERARGGAKAAPPLRTPLAGAYSGAGGAPSVGAAGTTLTKAGVSASVIDAMAGGGLLQCADALFGEVVPYEQQPEAPQPALLTTLLLPHQRKAVSWMLQREHVGSVSVALDVLAMQRASAAAALPLPPGAAGGGAAAAAAAAAATVPPASQFLFWRRHPGGGFHNVLTKVPPKCVGLGSLSTPAHSPPTLHRPLSRGTLRLRVAASSLTPWALGKRSR